MRKVFLIILSIITINGIASNPLKLGVMTDPHFLSQQLMDGAYAVQNYVHNSGKNVIASPQILDKVVADYVASDIEILLVCGDLSKDGEKLSHLDFRDKLKPLHDKGVKIFVIPGNHDINMPNATKYQGNKTFKTENISPKEFAQIYADYGYSQAMKRDATSLSYLAELSNDTWLLAIDAAQYDDYKDAPTSAGRVNDTTIEWIGTMLDLAKSENKQLIAMMHWGLAEHIPMQASLFKNYLVDDYKRIASLLADGGVRAVFTGHFHSNDITMFESANGNKIYDIETASLISYPFAYRFVELKDGEMKLTIKNITSTPSHPKLAEESKQTMKKIAVQRALPLLRDKGFVFLDDKLTELSEIAGELFILHASGDEVVSDQLKDSIISIFKEKGFPVDDELNNLEIDLPPLDNNITILLH